MDNLRKIFTIHFPGKRVYIEKTFGTKEEKLNFIKDNKDHKLYPMFKDYPNPEIRFECYKDENCNERYVALKYLNYNLLN